MDTIVVLGVIFVLILFIFFLYFYLMWMRKQKIYRNVKKQDIILDLEPFDDTEINFEEEEIQDKLLVHIDV